MESCVRQCGEAHSSGSAPHLKFTRQATYLGYKSASFCRDAPSEGSSYISSHPQTISHHESTMNAPIPTPPGALTRLPQIRESNKSLLSALESHPSFAAQQRARSGKVYFMHDFASRTDAMFDSILNDAPAPDTPATRGSVPQARPSTMSAAQKDELKSDAVGRCMMCVSPGKKWNDMGLAQRS